jgi:hypothetical protein
MNIDMGIVKQPPFMPPFPANNKLSPCKAQLQPGLSLSPIPRREYESCVNNETIL